MMKMKQFQKIKHAYESIVERSHTIKKDFLKNRITAKEILLSIIKNTKIKDIIPNLVTQFFLSIVVTFVFNIIQVFTIGNNSLETSVIVLFLFSLLSFIIFTCVLYSNEKKKILKKSFVSQTDINYLLDFFHEIDKKSEVYSQERIAGFKRSLERHIKEQEGYVTFGFYQETMENCKIAFDKIKSQEIESNAKEITDTIIADFYKEKEKLEAIDMKERETV